MAKMEIEERMKRQQRDKKMEEARKRIVETPNKKRGRQDAGGWAVQTVQPAVAALSPGSGARTPTGAQKMLQTPMQTFLVHQSVEDRRKSIARRMRTRTPSTRNEADQKMSASSASPALKMGRGRKTGARMTSENDRNIRPNVLSMKKFFDDKAKLTQSLQNGDGQDNNNAVSANKMQIVCSTVGQPASMGGVSAILKKEAD